MEELLLSNVSTFIPLVVALVLGGLLGLERSFAGKTAGMRTYALVSVGSALFIIISQIVVSDFTGVTNFDPLRVASQIIVGIGFLGAGSIILNDDTGRVGGLTTAAGLWVSAGIGMAVGFGLYCIAVFVTVLTLLVFTGLWYLEQGITKGKKGK